MTSTHKHHWIIDPPIGPTSMGRCINRGCPDKVQEFSNVLPFDYGNQKDGASKAPPLWLGLTRKHMFDQESFEWD